VGNVLTCPQCPQALLFSSMNSQNLRSLNRPRGCKVLKQVGSPSPQPLVDKPIQDRVGYILSLQGLSAKEKSLMLLFLSRFLFKPTFRASTKWLARKLSCSRPTLHRVLRRLEGRWIVIWRYRGNQNVYGPAPRFANVIRRCQMRNGGYNASTRKGLLCRT
jgi:hypothetical protein